MASYVDGVIFVLNDFAVCNKLVFHSKMNKCEFARDNELVQIFIFHTPSI